MSETKVGFIFVYLSLCFISIFFGFLLGIQFEHNKNIDFLNKLNIDIDNLNVNFNTTEFLNDFKEDIIPKLNEIYKNNTKIR